MKQTKNYSGLNNIAKSESNTYYMNVHTGSIDSIEQWQEENDCDKCIENGDLIQVFWDEKLKSWEELK